MENERIEVNKFLACLLKHHTKKKREMRRREMNETERESARANESCV